ncbi:MAG TPA: LytTR family DNA-binding domain-containing protein [Bacteroidia bacterium]|nr:LytTR family DNA-binding domain-containing protein [Bacteroidia bacterium]
MLKAIIVDDEHDNREALRAALSEYCPDVELSGTCESAEEGAQAIARLKPDIVFLDIQMPFMSGFDLLKKFPDPQFDVVFVTAYNQYAIKAIKFSALDYLLKPVDVDELRDAVNKALQKRNKEDYHLRMKSFIQNVSNHQAGIGKISIPTMEGLLFIDHADIIRCKADDKYTEIFLVTDKKLFVSRTLGEIEEMLGNEIFFRIHHSHLINLKYIERYIKGIGGQVVMKNGSVVDVSRKKKEEFLKLLGK